jgi:nitrate reductase gamma subunit
MLLRRTAALATGSLLLSGLLSPLAAGTSDSWLIDPERYHISAHGQITCTTCHDAVASSAAHPDPLNVDKPAARPDPTAGCLVCHDGVQTALEQGRHGRMTRRQADRFQSCVACHDPHTAIKLADRVSKHVGADKPAEKQCGACHETRETLPKPAADDAKCMECHASRPGSRTVNEALCLHCHGDGQSEAQVATARVVAKVDVAVLGRSPHAGVSCTVCHPGAASYGHAQQSGGDCLQCHERPHSAAHEEHLNVDCRVCHVSGGRIVVDGATQRMVRARAPGQGLVTHDMTRHPSRQSCVRCHFEGNAVGASAAVLPSKSVLCLGCHASTLSVGDAVTIPSLLVFVLGLAAAMSLWLSGIGGLGAGLKTIFSARILVVLKSLLLDTVWQRRLLRQSTARWAIHSLIFLPFVIRFTWGAATLLASWVGARGAWFLVLLDKNHPLNAFLFDVTGVSIIVGVCAAVAHGIATRRQRLAGLPGQDRAALALIGGVVVVGFLLEGMRMAMTGASGGAAFLGYALSHAFTAGPGLERAYGHVWYLHAALTGAFVAYLPFSRMFHILVAPVVLARRAVRHAAHGVHAAGD